MRFALCTHCNTSRIVVLHNRTGQYHYRRHGSADTAGKRITCPGSLQPLPPHLTPQET